MPGLLGLAPELLHRVASLTDDNTLANLRLSCKRLQATSFDTFAAKYLHNLTCYTFESKRIEQVQNIMFTPALAAKVRCVSLTTRKREGRVDSRSGTSDFERGFSVGFALSDLFAALKNSDCRLEVEMAGRSVPPNICDLTDDTLMHEEGLLSATLGAANSAGLSITGLAMRESDLVVFKDPRTSRAAERVISELQSFCFTSNSAPDIIMGNAAARALRDALVDAKDLKHIAIYSNGWPRTGHDLPDFFFPTSQPALRSLTLSLTSINSATLSSILKTCGHDLQCLSFVYCSVMGDWHGLPPCRTFLRTLQSLPALHSLTLSIFWSGEGAPIVSIHVPTGEPPTRCLIHVEEDQERMRAELAGLIDRDELIVGEIEAAQALVDLHPEIKELQYWLRHCQREYA